MYWEFDQAVFGLSEIVGSALKLYIYYNYSRARAGNVEMTEIAPKKLELNPRQRKFLKFYIETGNASLSAKKAGYSDYRVHPYDILAKPSFKAAYHELLDKNGITDEKLVRVLSEGLDAKKLVYVENGDALDKQGNPTKTQKFDDDFATRHKYLETGLKLKNHLDSDSDEAIQRSIINIFRFEDKQDGRKTEEVAGRIRIHRDTISSNGIGVGNRKKLVRNPKSPKILRTISK